MKLHTLITAVALSSSSLFTAAADAPVQVQNAWARATVKGQLASGAFMTLKAKDGATLVGASSPAAGVVQVHEMKMDGGVMKMAEVKGGLDLPAGKAVELKPGGYHIMLMDLKAPLAAGSTIPLTLTVKDDKGMESKVELKVPVKQAAPANAGAGMSMGMDKDAHGAHGMHGKQ
ncbi:MAG: copper chaperone PCu(A)C [Rhodoferax sp.]|nr:copper chaperone PCu(A)C [Rhodoferax sp.]